MERKNIIIIILIAIVAIIGIGIILSAGMPHEKTYEPYNFSATCSIELPTWINFNNGAGDMNSNSNVMGSDVESTTKALFGNNEVMQITYGHSAVDGANVGVDLNDNMEFEQNGKKVYTRMVMSEETGESVTVMGENEEVVNYIADHVKFNGKNATGNKTNTTNDNVNSNTQSNNDVDKNKNDDEKKYTQEDLDKAHMDGYDIGYDDGYESYYDQYDYSYSSSPSESSSIISYDEDGQQSSSDFD